MTLNIAILGAGRIGTVHADAVTRTPGARLAAISDPVAAAAQAIADRHGCAIATIDAIASDADIGAVVICTPTDTHSDLIERFVRAGKAVFCEKPVDLSVARAQACLRTVEAEGGLLMVGFQRRFDPDFNALKAVIDAGDIGTVEMVTLVSRDPGPPPGAYIARSGGIFRDMTIHDFDVARWLLGEEVATVQAAASNLVDPAIGKLGDYDTANVILVSAGGRQATINNSRRATYGYDQRIEVHGSLGSVAAMNRHKANIVVANAQGYTVPPLLDFFMTRYTAAYAAEIAAFVACVTDGTAPPTTGHDGVMALALADAALRSVRDGRAVAVTEILDA